jgi:hypothetical protein
LAYVIIDQIKQRVVQTFYNLIAERWRLKLDPLRGKLTRWRFLPAKGALILKKFRRKSKDQRMPLEPDHGLCFLPFK